MDRRGTKKLKCLMDRIGWVSGSSNNKSTYVFKVIFQNYTQIHTKYS